MEANFRAGGLASGLDTNSIIEQLVKIQSRSIDAVKRQQDGFRSQISALGDIVSKLNALATAAKDLKSNGALGVKQVGTASGFTATPTASAQNGSYSVLVDDLATAAKARSQSFASTAAPVTGGTLDLSIRGNNFSIALTDGMSLADAASAIRASGAPVSATVLESGGAAYLSITAKETGFVVGQPAASALTITETSNGVLGQPITAAITQTALNAKVTVDGLPFERSSNILNDVVPGVEIALTAKTVVAENLVLTNDTAKTEENLKKFVDAYNDVMKSVRANLNVNEKTDRTKTLVGDSALRSLQSTMQRLVSGVLNADSTVRTLADAGVKTGSDGMLSIDNAKLSKAISADPQGINQLFQKATTGIGDVADQMADQYANSTDGLLVTRKNGLDKSIKKADQKIGTLQLRIDKYRDRLILQFAAMEKIVSSFKSIGDFLNQQATKKES